MEVLLMKNGNQRMNGGRLSPREGGSVGCVG